MKFWQSLAFCEPEQCAAVARCAEELGFEGVTLAEHQFFPEQLASRFPFSPDGRPLFDAEDEWPEMWPLIGAMAGATARLRFCTAVHILPLFHPLPVARSAATADALARGDRVELRGFGAFSVKRRGARTGRNPRTGEQVPVEEKRVPYFKTGKDLRERLNK